MAPASRSIDALTNHQHRDRAAVAGNAQAEVGNRQRFTGMVRRVTAEGLRKAAMNSRIRILGWLSLPPCQSRTTTWLPVPSPAAIRPGASEAMVAKPIAVRTGERV